MLIQLEENLQLLESPEGPKEKARLHQQKEERKRGENFPGADKSTKRGGQQQQNERVEEDTDSDCFMCSALGQVEDLTDSDGFMCSALGRPSFMTHEADSCFKRNAFTKGR